MAADANQPIPIRQILGQEVVRVERGLETNLLKLSEAYDEAFRCDTVDGVEITALYDAEGALLEGEFFFIDEPESNPRQRRVTILRKLHPGGPMQGLKIAEMTYHSEIGKALLVAIDSDQPLHHMDLWVFRFDSNRRTPE